ncbi:MAG: response regulator [Myxococcota bacterium]
MLGPLIARHLPECCVTVERGARKALARIDAGEPFDRIICDVVMPGMGGREFFEHIDRAHPHLLSRLAFMSGGVLTDLDRQWLAMLKRPLLRKPFSREELVHLLDALAD